ncbi:MAG: DUF4426 domain-containing protein [Steroidobacteraceae bacterium]
MPRAQIFAFACLAVAGCADDSRVPPPAPEFSDPGFVSAGDVRLDYALTLMRDLDPAIAGSYGIVPRPNLALLVITLAPAEDARSERITAVELEAEAVTLIGDRQPLPLRLVNEHGGPSYLATVTVRHREPITIVIRARPRADAREISARLTREFHLQ